MSNICKKNQMALDKMDPLPGKFWSSGTIGANGPTDWVRGRPKFWFSSSSVGGGGNGGDCDPGLWRCFLMNLPGYNHGADGLWVCDVIGIYKCGEWRAMVERYGGKSTVRAIKVFFVDIYKGRNERNTEANGFGVHALVVREFTLCVALCVCVFVYCIVCACAYVGVSQSFNSNEKSGPSGERLN